MAARAGALWSLSALAQEFGVGWNVIKRRMTGVSPDGDIRGNPAWRISTAAPHLCEPVADEEGVEIDLDAMDPKDRRDWIASERDLNKLRLEAGDLIPADEVREELATLVKATVQVLDTLGDVLEREASLSGEQVEVVSEIVDRLREQLYGALERVAIDEEDIDEAA